MNGYISTSIKKEPYKKLARLANHEGRTISKMLEIIIGQYNPDNLILEEIQSN